MSNFSNPNHSLTYSQIYSCPVCRHGKIASLTLMEAFACDFCNHIFVADMEQQIIQMADTQLATKWRWDGKNWKNLKRNGVEFNGGYGIAGVIFVLFPTFIISLSVYFFPPLPGSRLSWLPVVWIILTFLSHLLCLLWLVVEYYQFPILRYLRLIRRRLSQ